MRGESSSIISWGAGAGKGTPLRREQDGGETPSGYDR